MGDSDASVPRAIGHILHRRLRRGLWDARPHVVQEANAELAVSAMRARVLRTVYVGFLAPVMIAWIWMLTDLMRWLFGI